MRIYAPVRPFALPILLLPQAPLEYIDPCRKLRVLSRNPLASSDDPVVVKKICLTPTRLTDQEGRGGLLVSELGLWPEETGACLT
jgi:hypothetical protein